MSTFYTIGHSTRSLEELIDLLREHAVTLLVDVRTVPRSRTNPQFNQDSLPAALAAAGIGYRHIAELGGLRSRRRGAPPTRNGFWENASFRNYADYADSDAFRHGLALLRELGQRESCAIMCSEAVWWRCHRRIIADYLLVDGDAVLHIMARGRTEPARLTAAAHRTSAGTLIYPAAAGA